MNNKRVNKTITLVPFISILIICILFIAFPISSNEVLTKIRFFFGDTLGNYYLILGLGIFLVSVFMAVSRYGKITLGEPGEKPKYSFFSWGCMMFTCGLAADILFYSFSEWILYANEEHVQNMGNVWDYAGVFPLFHWGFIPWAFYLVLAVSFGYMLHVRKTNKQKYSEACRPLLGKATDSIAGTLIDLLAVFALIAGTATTFSVATPLMATILNNTFHLNIDSSITTIIILIITCITYTTFLMKGFNGINLLAKICVYMFFGILLYVFLFGGQAIYTIETGLKSFGTMIAKFFEFSTYSDPERTTSFPQNYTIYYWAYWMVWAVAAPFFIGNISKGRTVRQVIVGGYIFGTGATLICFIILGNYSMGLQESGLFDFLGEYVVSYDSYSVILSILQSLPHPIFIMMLVLLTMIAFYATSFDSIAYTAACYSYKSLSEEEKPEKPIQLMWCILLIILPIALIFSESSMYNIQSVSIISAFPLGIVIVLIIISFFKDARGR